MIKKVLIAEDHESANLSVQITLADLGITQPDHAYYCDDAFNKVRIGVEHGEPYDLLITDLFFEQDTKPQQISGGLSLIPAVRQVQPDLKIMVFSAESSPAIIEMLYEKLEIDGYVRKARNDARELKTAMEFIAGNQRYLPRQLSQVIKEKNAHDFTAYDITIISLLSNGTLQKDIPAYLQENKIRPAGLSSVEKRLNLIREKLAFSKNEQLVAYCKDMGII